MKTTAKTIALASIIVLGSGWAFARPARDNGRKEQEKVVTVTTVKTTTIDPKVKEHPKKVHQAETKKAERPAPVARESSPRHMAGKRQGPNRNRHVAKRPAGAKPVSHPECRPEPVAKHKPCAEVPKHVGHAAPAPAHVKVVTKVEKRPHHCAGLDGKSVAAGAIVGGIIALTAVAASN